MKITLRRNYDTNNHTVGILQVGSRVFTTLEDSYNSPKIAGKTRIPPGTYEIDLRTTSPMATKYARRFLDHNGMIWLKNIPQFDYVYIHIGNSEDDTEGCILVGRTMDPKKGFVGDSVSAYKELYPLIMYAHKQGEQITITITDQFS